MTAARCTHLDHGITAVDTDYVRPLLAASHLINEGGRCAFVDTGSNHSVPFLLDALRQQELDSAAVDYVFLTHIHLDHAGGAGLLMQSLPNARAVIHPRGARHMIDPSKLIKGSQAVYGKEVFARLYGELQAIDKERVIVAGDGQRFDLNGRELYCFYTEGHARHHYCLHDATASAVFTGDSFGVSYRELDTANGEFVFPTTTPVHFDPREAHRTVDRIIALAPAQCLLTHYSRVNDVARLAADLHQCLDDFVAMAESCRQSATRTLDLEAAMFDYLGDRAVRHGVADDEARLRAIIGMDVKLNTQGLEHWLEHGSPSDR